MYQRELDRQFRGKPDIAYDICYRADGRLVCERVGALSEGYSPQLAATVRGERTRSIRHGDELPRLKQAPLFRDAWARYIEWAKKNKRDWQHDEARYTKHLAPRSAHKRLDQISPLDLERIKSDLTKEDLAPATVEHRLVIVRQVYNKATAWDIYRGANPIKSVKLTTLSNERTRFLSYGEAELLLTELARRSMTILGLILYVREILKPRAAFVVYDRHRVSPTARKYYEGAFTSGKEVLYLTIMSQHTLKEMEHRVQKMLAHETVIKVLTLDPDLPVEAIESIRRHLNENSDNPSETTHQIRRAWEHWTAIKNKYPNIEVRKYKSTPTMQGVIVRDDYALFELIRFDTPPEERPGLIVTKKDNPEVSGSS